MQVSAQPRSLPSGGRYRSPASDLVASIEAAVEQSARRGGRPGGSDREDHHSAPDPRTEKSGHKTVFLARSLSSTLTELQIASGATESAAKADRLDVSSGQASDTPLSLDDLLSSFLSAA